VLIALGIAAAAFLALLSIRQLVVRRLGKVAEKTATGIDDLAVALARRTPVLVLTVVSIWLGSFYLALHPNQERTLRTAAEVVLFLQLALWSSVAIDFWVDRQRRRMEHDATSFALAGVLRFVGKLLLWSVLLLLALENLGVDVTALVAGLGIGGVAVALALQNVLGDLLASLSIVLDKPFVIGDSITVDDMTGTVESIGLKTTRLRSASGEQIVISNGDLLKSRIRNWKRMAERRVVLNFGLPLGTPPDLIEKVPGMVRRIVESRDLTRFERAHFTRFSAATVEFEAVYWILTPEYGVFMDRQQAINLELLRALAAEGTAMAPPAQKVVLERPPRRPETSV
jgi:small-conductance mechanosensitive channel